MAVYLQFDSSARTDAYIQYDLGGSLVWMPNDNYINVINPPYQQNNDLVQSPSQYRVFYKQLNETNNTRTIGFLEHCKDRPTNLTFSVESCVLIVPTSGLFPRLTAGPNPTLYYTSVLDEPYLYVRMMPINHAEGNLIYSNNPPADEATFIMWIDRLITGTNYDTSITQITRPNNPTNLSDIIVPRWITYKTCMATVMRLNLAAEEWQIRIYDRYGNSLILAESDNGGAGFPVTSPPPMVDPNLQTMLLVGIKPNYPL
jgi:hypothetical protein